MPTILYPSKDLVMNNAWYIFQVKWTSRTEVTHFESLTLRQIDPPPPHFLIILFSIKPKPHTMETSNFENQ